eukprot:403362083
MDNNERSQKIWRLLETILEVYNQLAQLGLYDSFTLRTLEDINFLANRKIANRNDNISALASKLEKNLEGINDRTNQYWRLRLGKGSIIYLNEGQQEHTGLGRVEIIKKIKTNVFAVSYQDKQGTMKNEIIGRWSKKIYIPTNHQQIINNWWQNLKVGYRVLALDKYKNWILSTILDVSANNEQVLERVKVGYRIYNDQGDLNDEKGNYFGFEGKFDEWIDVFSLRVMPMVLFEVSQGKLEVVKYLIEHLNLKYQIAGLKYQQDRYYQFKIRRQYGICKTKKLLLLSEIIGNPLYLASESGNIEILK